MSLPKISIFTPTHNPQYLGDTFQSLVNQAYPNWEWLVAPNAPQGKPLPSIPSEIKEHPRVRYLPHHYEGDPYIGRLKRYCCERATGDAFLELDHDDMLVPGALGDTATCLADGAGFVYSDTALFRENKHGEIIASWYHGDWGWESYDFSVYGRRFVATRNFPLTPRNLCEIYFAPDHLRCWSRKAYEDVGGHNENLEVGDDHELIIRTYLGGHQFAHTGGVGYLYRFHRGNTVKSHQEKIQKQQDANRDKYTHKLIDEWLSRHGLAFLNLDSYYPFRGEDPQWPRVKADTYGCIRAYVNLQAIPTARLTDFFQFCYDALVPGGWLCLKFPTTDGAAAFVPGVRSYWNRHVLDYYSDRRFARKIGNTRIKFQVVRAQNIEGSQFEKERNIRYMFADLCALKDQRQPGRVFI
jgi:glycosyltransferase involved in cell wall biosynthesis